MVERRDGVGVDRQRTNGERRPGSARLAAAVRRVGTARRGVGLAPAPLEVKPSNAFEVAIAEQIKAMRRDLERLEERLWWLFALILGAAVTNVVLAVLAP